MNSKPTDNTLLFNGCLTTEYSTLFTDSWIFLAQYAYHKKRSPRGIFHVGLPVKIMKTLVLSLILATYPAYLNLLHLISLTILDKWYKFDAPHCKVFLLSHPFDLYPPPLM